MNKKQSLPQQLLDYIITEHGSKMGVFSSNFVTKFSQSSRMTRRGAEKWLSGESKSFRRIARENLSTFFEPAIPGIEPDWFEVLSLEEFRGILDQRMGSVDFSFPVNFNATEHSKIAVALRTFASKKFFVYRFAFNGVGEIIRELIWFENINGDLYFSNFTKMENGGETIEFKGRVLNIGDTTLLLSSGIGELDYQPRLRTILLKSDPPGSSNKKFKTGFLNSTTPPTSIHPNGQPCMARIVLEELGDTPPSLAEVTGKVRFFSHDQLLTGHRLGGVILKHITNVLPKGEFVNVADVGKFNHDFMRSEKQ